MHIPARASCTACLPRPRPTAERTCAHGALSVRAQEWRKPKLFVNDDGKKDDHLHDLIKGLLEWKSDKRLGSSKAGGSAAGAAEVKAHKYWGAPEWQLIELCRMPSPLRPYVDKRARSKISETKLRKQQRAAVETAVRMAATDARTAKARKGGGQGDEQARILEDDRELDVPKWDFVSPHAVEQEYVETMASSASLI